MAHVVDWSLDHNILKKQLLMLAKKDLIKVCKHKQIPFNRDRRDTIHRLLVGAGAFDLKGPKNDELIFEEDEAEPELSPVQVTLDVPVQRHSMHGKHVTHFSECELAAVGLSWMKPKPRISCIIPPPNSSSSSMGMMTTPIKARDIPITHSPSSLNASPQKHFKISPPKTARVASWVPNVEIASTTQTLEQELNKKIESYGTFEVMSSLLFGFAVSVAFQNVNKSQFENQNVYTHFADILFTIFIVVVLIANAYTMIVLSSTYFYVHRYMADKEYVMASIYLKIYADYRKYARMSFYIGLVCFIISIGIYLVASSPNTVNAICVLLFLSLGLLMILYTLIAMTNPSRIANKDNPGHRKFLEALFAKGGVQEKVSD